MDGRYIAPTGEVCFRQTAPLKAVARPNWIGLASYTVILAVSFCFSTKTKRVDFRHFNKGLTVSFSHDSPPMAAIEDMNLKQVPEETVHLSRRRGLHSHILLAGKPDAWSHLQQYANFFEAKYLVPVAQHHSQPPHRHPTFKPMAITELVGIIKPIPFRPASYHQILHRRVTETAKYSRLVLPRIVATTTFRPQIVSGLAENKVVATGQPVVANDSSFHVMTPDIIKVDAPLTTPSVPRGLPRGEDTISSAVGAPVNPVVVSGLAVIPPPKVVRAPTALNSQPPHIVAIAPPHRPNLTKASSTNVRPAIKVAQLNLASKSQVLESKITPQQPPAPVMNGCCAIAGQVELTGGLAATGDLNKLAIHFENSDGSHIAAGVVDYSSGQYYIPVTHYEQGRITATLEDANGMVIGEGDTYFDGDIRPGMTYVDGTKVVLEPVESEIDGRVYSAYSFGAHYIPVAGAQIIAPNNVREITDKQGMYELTGISSQSTFHLDAYADGFWGTRVMANGMRRPEIPLFPNKMINSFLSLIGQSSNATQLGIVWGVVKKQGKALAGAEVSLPSGGAIGPFYFNELMLPDTRLTKTASNGLFAYVKVAPGIHVIHSRYKNHDLPPSVISVEAGLVTYAPIAAKALSVVLQVQDFLSQKPIPSLVRSIGHDVPLTLTEASQPWRLANSDPLLFFDVVPSMPQYLETHTNFTKEEAQHAVIPVFEKTWIAQQMASAGITYDVDKAFAIVHVTGPAFQVTLDNEADYSDANTGYFDEKGQLDPARSNGLAGSGFAILHDLKPGPHTMVITSADGSITVTRLFVSQPKSLTYLNILLKP